MPLFTQATRSHTKSRECLRRLAAIALFVLVAAPLACAQNYKADEVVGSLSKQGGIAKKFAKNGSGDEALFKQYFERYFLPSMTQSGAEGLADLERYQKELFKSYLLNSSGATRAYLNEKATEFAVRVANDRKYHPAVRYNAFLILGRLMDDYDSKVPSAAANKELCKWASLGATNEKVYGYELAGALIGLERHTQLKDGLGKDEARSTMAALYKVLKTESLPMSLDSEVSDWLYLTAAKGIGNFKQPGPRGGLFAALIAKKASDSSISLKTRAAIAAELARMELKPDNVKAEPLVKVISDLALAIATEEEEIATKFENMQIGGAARFVVGARGKLSSRIREGKDNAQGQPVLVREGLLELLTELRKSVKTVKGIATGESQTKMTTVEQAITDAISSVSDKQKGDLSVAGAVRTMGRQIKDKLETTELEGVAAQP